MGAAMDLYLISGETVSLIPRATGMQAVFADTWKRLHSVNDLPYIFNDGTMKWYEDGVLHRENGPAVVYADGVQCWYTNGKQHRTDGPAVEHPSGEHIWYLRGAWIRTAEAFAKRTKKSKDDMVMLTLMYGEIC